MNWSAFLKSYPTVGFTEEASLYICKSYPTFYSLIFLASVVRKVVIERKTSWDNELQTFFATVKTLQVKRTLLKETKSERISQDILASTHRNSRLY